MSLPDTAKLTREEALLRQMADFEPALKFRCPTCEADPGEPCRESAYMRDGYIGMTHAIRDDIAYEKTGIEPRWQQAMRGVN